MDAEEGRDKSVEGFAGLEFEDSRNSGTNMVKLMEDIGKEGNKKCKHTSKYDPHDHGSEG
jgi:hypothetical protein